MKLTVHLFFIALCLLPLELISEDLKQNKINFPDNSTAIIYVDDIKHENYFNIVNKNISSIYSVLSKFFKPSKPLTTEFIILDSQKFQTQTGLANWINAIYHKERIFIPVKEHKEFDEDKLLRSIKHEYAHAFINNETKGKAPYFFDEGLAVWLEGELHPSFKLLLASYIKKHKSGVRLIKNNVSFAKLPSKEAKAAYAYSRFFIGEIIKQFGIFEINKFIKKINNCDKFSACFNEHFKTTFSEFSTKLDEKLLVWAKKELR